MNQIVGRMPEGRPHRSQPAAHEAGDQRASGGEGERDALYLKDDRTQQRTAIGEDEGDVGHVGHLIGHAQHGGGVGILRAADDGEDVA